MKGDEQVVSYLNKALRHELAAVNQYWLHYRLQLDWGYAKIARRSRAESIEEMEHADKLIDRIIFLEGFPNLQQIDRLRIGETLKETLECDLAGEQSARSLYREAREVCREHGDFVTKALFDELLEDEEGHIDFLESQLSLMTDIGEQNYGLLNATAADKAEH